MTEAVWLWCPDPTPMLEHVRRSSAARMGARKRRLFACACCRRILGFLDHEGVAQVDAAEQFADNPGRYGTFIGVREATAAAAGAPRAAALAAGRKDDVATIRFAADQAVFAVSKSWRDILSMAEKQAQAALLRDIVGNPFRPVSAAPRWLTAPAVGLARAIYEERAFDRLPILADALEEAGCDHADVLSHCRSGGPHVRGCWVVDLLLGKG